jgi:hypothetical protein
MRTKASRPKGPCLIAKPPQSSRPQEKKGWTLTVGEGGVRDLVEDVRHAKVRHEEDVVGVHAPVRQRHELEQPLDGGHDRPKKKNRALSPSLWQLLWSASLVLSYIWIYSLYLTAGLHCPLLAAAGTPLPWPDKVALVEHPARLAYFNFTCAPAWTSAKKVA